MRKWHLIVEVLGKLEKYLVEIQLAALNQRSISVKFREGSTVRPYDSRFRLIDSADKIPILGDLLFPLGSHRWLYASKNFRGAKDSREYFCPH